MNQSFSKIKLNFWKPTVFFFCTIFLLKKMLLDVWTVHANIFLLAGIRILIQHVTLLYTY